MYVKRLRNSTASISDLAEEVFQKIVANENPTILDHMDRNMLRKSIFDNLSASAEAIGYPETGRKHSGQIPLLD